MQLRHFVCGSATILMGWLAFTFVYKVPSQRYPRPDQYPATTLLEKKPQPENGVVQVSDSQ